MHRNWQQADGPNFTWPCNRLTRAKEQFLLGGGGAAGTLGHLKAAVTGELTIGAVSVEAVTTSEIKGGMLDWQKRIRDNGWDLSPSIEKRARVGVMSASG